MTTFGVYPLAAQVRSGGLPLSTDHTFLPFWPGHGRRPGWPGGCRSPGSGRSSAPPEQAACPALLNNDLASSLAGSGRLGWLLAGGQHAAAGLRADLTWAIDPSLLSSAAVMTPALPGGRHGRPAPARPTKRASPAARAWLARLQHGHRAAGLLRHPVRGRGRVRARARRPGHRPAARMRQGEGRDSWRRSPSSWAAPSGRAAPAAGAIAWPADGIADYGGARQPGRERGRHGRS